MDVLTVRVEIDAIDDQIVALLARRHELAQAAQADREWNGRGGRDRVRERQVLDRVRERAGYPAEVVERIWTAMFEAPVGDVPSKISE